MKKQTSSSQFSNLGALHVFGFMVSVAVFVAVTAVVFVVSQASNPESAGVASGYSALGPRSS